MTSKDLSPTMKRLWKEDILPSLSEFVSIPCLSQGFDPQWEKNGHLRRAFDLVAGWCRERGIEGMQMEILQPPGRTPLLLIEIPGKIQQTTLLYGHLDKQPEFSGWDEDKGPWKPVFQNDRLYGRGSGDDGYAPYAAIAAIEALRENGVPHGRCVILIEGGEESGSPDLPIYIEELQERIGDVSLIVCLDSGCADYDQLWTTTSLRGIVMGTLSIRLISEGIHSGDASGVIPSSFRVLRMLMDRLEDAGTGEILLKDCHGEIPDSRREQARQVADVLGETIHTQHPFHEGVQPVTLDLTELILNRTRRPALAYTGVDGMPALKDAGNVMRPLTTIQLSLRLPPDVDPDKADAALKKLLEQDPPYGAKVEYSGGHLGPGWDAPEFAPWLEKSLEESSRRYFGAPACHMGEGGSIPFMNLLGEKFPKAQFLVTGVLGPGSNAHGPNEFLDLPTVEKLSCCVAQVIADLCEHHS